MPGIRRIAFEKRTTVPVSDTRAIQLRGTKLCPLERFLETVHRHRVFIEYLKRRNRRIDDLNNELSMLRTGHPPERRGSYDETFRKHLWFAECMSLLDVINAFEFFFKTTFIILADAIAPLIDERTIKGQVEALSVWQAPRDYSPRSLVLEHRLFHNTEDIDEVSHMLIRKRRYSGDNETRLRVMAIFQIRHTLSHNSGQMTASDRSRLSRYGFSTSSDIGVIDPSEDNLTESIFDYLSREAEEYSKWLIAATESFVVDFTSKNPGVSVSTLLEKGEVVKPFLFQNKKSQMYRKLDPLLKSLKRAMKS